MIRTATDDDVFHAGARPNNAHQRFVNTTPKPRATKNNNGEEPPPLLLLLLLLLLPPVFEGSVVVVGGTLAAEVGPAENEVGLASEDVADGVTLESTVCLTWCCKARTARLARPARSALSITMAAAEVKSTTINRWTQSMITTARQRTRPATTVCCELNPAAASIHLYTPRCRPSSVTRQMLRQVTP